ncbi:MAG TPA: hypothetical protein VE338_06655 [Ktedonobacterales bacterium]|nr:hypothetical protein [Ktedonobacterales bacterium]
MQILWEPILLVPLVAMVIPVAILIGQWVRGGALTSLSAGALLGIVIYLAPVWVSLWSSDASYSFSLPGTLALASGAVLLLGGFAIAGADALRVRRRGWVVGLCVTVYATFVALVGLTITPIRSCMYLMSGPPACAPPDVGRILLFSAASLVGPGVMLLYALRAQGSEALAPVLPDGLTVSRLDATDR